MFYNLDMYLEFNFKNIKPVNGKEPVCRINLNGDDVFTGAVKEHICLSHDGKQNNVIEVFFENKTGKDTIVDTEGKIVADLSFELERLKIDGVDFKHLIWQSSYHYNDIKIDSCLFFGPKGYWQIEFSVPVLRWWLELNHNKNNDDPTWEQDYKHYEEVCQRLDKIQTR